MKKTQCFSMATFIAAVGFAAFLCVCLAWLLSVSQFATNPEFPPVAVPLGARYWQFLGAVLPGMFFFGLGIGIVAVIGRRRCKLLCGTLGIVLFHRLLELHIVFVLMNSALKN